MEKQPESKRKSCRERPSLKLEQAARQQGYSNIAGIDEAGRGPMAGPVVVASVILPPDWKEDALPLNDSKKLSESLRESLFDQIREQALDYKIIVISPEEIDRLNILQATFLGMRRAAAELSVAPDYVLIDGNQYPLPNSQAGEAVVKGDGKSLSIAAASILAKVKRDRIMVDYSQKYPQWSFEKHKGYPTAQHREAIEQHGLCPIHRRSFGLAKEKAKQEQLSLFS